MGNQNYKILVVNPGSTSTKIAVFENDLKIFSKNIAHQASELSEFNEVNEQLEYRLNLIVKSLEEEKIELTSFDAVAARCGGTTSMDSGVYAINQTMLDDQRSGKYVQHPAILGAQIAHILTEQYGGQAFIVNSPDVDEFQDVARITGVKGIYRESKIHALNQKEVALRFAEKQGKNYDSLNLIIAHIGGGVSVTAHHYGKMIDSNDISNGDGPMAPTRIGFMPAKSMLAMGADNVKAGMALLTKTGGLVSHLGTSDVLEVKAMIESGNAYAKLIYEAFIYQIGKAIGAMAATLHGEADGIILTGGIAHDNELVEKLKAMIGFIAPVTVMAGEFEMEALAAGAIRVLSNQEKAKEYKGQPVWSPKKFSDKFSLSVN